MKVFCSWPHFKGVAERLHLNLAGLQFRDVNLKGRSYVISDSFRGQVKRCRYLHKRSCSWSIQILKRNALATYDRQYWEDVNWKTYRGTGEVPQPYFQWKWAKHWKMGTGKTFGLLHRSRCLLRGISRTMETQRAHSYLCQLEISLQNWAAYNNFEWTVPLQVVLLWPGARNSYG